MQFTLAIALNHNGENSLLQTKHLPARSTMCVACMTEFEAVQQCYAKRYDSWQTRRVENVLKQETH